MTNELHKHDVLYYASVFKNFDIYDVVELSVCEVKNTWIVGVEKRTEDVYILDKNLIGRYIFFDRADALTVVKEAEKN